MPDLTRRPDPHRADRMADADGWQRTFDEPIPLPGGGALVSLRDAGEFIQALPPRQQKAAPWQTATRILIATAEGRDFVMHARIAVVRALKRSEANER